MKTMTLCFMLCCWFNLAFSQTWDEPHQSALIQFLIGEYSEAIKILDQAIEEHPDIHNLHYLRASAKFESGDLIGAMPDYTKVIQLHPRHVWALTDRGKLKYRLRDLRGAVNDFNMAIEIISESGRDNSFIKIDDIYYQRGLSHSGLSNHNQAIADFSMAIDLNPEFSAAIYGRGIATHHKGDLESACLDFSRAGELGYSLAYDTIRAYCN